MIDVNIADETVVKKRGRPRKQPLDAPTEHDSVPLETADFDADDAGESGARENIPPYPRLPRYSTLDAIISLWNGLTSEQRQFGNIYLYRDHPKMLLVMNKRGRLVNENCNKFNDEDGPITREVIWRLRRMGKYSVRIVQRVTKPYGQLSQASFELDGKLENIEDMPILDLEKLDRANPANESYLRILKLRGIIKVDEGKPDEGEEMAASEVLGNLTNKALDMLGNQPQQQPQASSDPNGIGISKALDLLDKQYQRATPPAQQGTVKEQLEGLVTLAKTMTPAPAAAPNMEPFLEMQKENNRLLMELKQKDVERAEAEAQKAREEAAQYRAALPQPKTVDEQWDELERAAKRFDRMTGRKKVEDEADDEEKNPATAAGFWGGLFGSLPAILKEGVALIREGNVMLYNYKLNGATAPPLNPATGQPGTQPLAPEQDEDDGPPLTPEEQAKMNHMQNVVNQLSALAQPMLHFLRNKTGTEFAKFVLDNYGPQAFELVRNVDGGRDTILAMIQQYPPVWNQIGPARLPQFTKFLDEFMAYSGVPVQ